MISNARGEHTMKIFLRWGRSVRLRDGAKENLIYTAPLDKFPDTPGLYVFSRQWGKGREALYVGKADNIRSRVKSQLRSNVTLMLHVKNARTGKRLVSFAEVETKPGQRLSKVLVLAERTFIRHFLAAGDDLVNIHGTRIRRHEVYSDGPQPRRFIHRVIFLEKGKGE
jgi:hypothetical protein